MAPVTILLSEAASTSARQTLYSLGRMGHTIDACDPQRLCLGRFSRYVRRFYRCPSFAAEPQAYLEFLEERLANGKYDVLFPVHDQVYLLARARQRLSRLAGLAVPEFDAVRRVQSKIQFSQLLDELGLPQPPRFIAKNPGELTSCRDYPCFVKLDFSTAGRGVWRVSDAVQMHSLAESLAKDWAPDSQGLLVQEVAAGELRVAQAVYHHGRLVASHAYRCREHGVGGSAHAREGIRQPTVREHLEQLGRHLNWHGALHLEYFYEPGSDRIAYIELNPRIGETFNATLSGANLCQMLVDVSLGRTVAAAPEAPMGVKTHNLLSSALARVERGGGRREVLRELGRAAGHREIYQESEDEIVRPSEDARSLIPFAAVLLQILAWPPSARKIVRGAVDAYSLNSASAKRIAELESS